jgi:hypothetical protein
VVRVSVIDVLLDLSDYYSSRPSISIADILRAFPLAVAVYFPDKSCAPSDEQQ